MSFWSAKPKKSVKSKRSRKTAKPNNPFSASDVRRKIINRKKRRRDLMKEMFGD